MYDFSDRVALVTGASRGIGRRVAGDLALAGARVILASRSETDVEGAASEIRAQGGEATAVVMDVGKAKQVQAVLSGNYEDFKRVDILVNNAGVTRDGLFLRMKPDDWDQVIRTNLDGIYNVTREVVRGMMRQRQGRIVNIASVVGQMGNAGQVNYAASKAGIIGFTKALAREVAARNVTVNAVAPGFIETAMTDRLGETVHRDLENSIPLKRIGNVRDVAHGVLFLASKEAGYITGHVLNINGGMYM